MVDPAMILSQTRPARRPKLSQKKIAAPWQDAQQVIELIGADERNRTAIQSLGSRF
jgi:hypothetical protein